MSNYNPIGSSIRNIGERLIPKSDLKNIPSEVKGELKDAIVRGKIFNDQFIYYILSYNPENDELFCLARVKYKFEYIYVKLKELERLGDSSKRFTLPVYIEPNEFATGDGYARSSDTNPKYTVSDVLSGYVK